MKFRVCTHGGLNNLHSLSSWAAFTRNNRSRMLPSVRVTLFRSYSYAAGLKGTRDGWWRCQRGVSPLVFQGFFKVLWGSARLYARGSLLEVISEASSA